MTQHIASLALLVPDYDQALDFYVGVLGFDVLEDTVLSPIKRWVRVAPKGQSGFSLLLARAEGPDQQAAIGRQAGGRVFGFLQTDDFARDHARMVAAGVTFLEEPRHEPYGTVAVFTDPFGTKWDLIEPAAP